MTAYRGDEKPDEMNANCKVWFNDRGVANIDLMHKTKYN